MTLTGRELSELAVNRAPCTLHVEGGPSFDVYRSEVDGAWVVHIDTDEDNMPCDERGPRPLRVYINDDTDSPAYENPRKPR